MGACCETMRNEYICIDNSDESSIREWEEEALSAFKSNFNDLMSRYNFMRCRISIKKAEKYFLREFGKEAVNLINQSYFNEDGYTCSKKLTALIFLLSKPEQKQSKDIVYYDKSLFLFQEILTHESENINDPIDKSNKKLIEFLNLLSDVAIDGISTYYLSLQKSSSISLYVNELIALKKNISQILIDAIFDWKELTHSQALSHQDISNLLKSNPFFLTSGCLRQLLLYKNRK